ncbi:hypothetical protein ABIB25_005341 [Nakamurella sp. UYEF19]
MHAFGYSVSSLRLKLQLAISAESEEQLLQDWVLWQRVRGMSDKTTTDRLTVIRRIPESAPSPLKVSTGS